jgi:hypothetical protein
MLNWRIDYSVGFVNTALDGWLKKGDEAAANRRRFTTSPDVPPLRTQRGGFLYRIKE